jgi:DNA-binding transcriptional LysR family regulator
MKPAPAPALMQEDGKSDCSCRKKDLAVHFNAEICSKTFNGSAVAIMKKPRSRHPASPAKVDWDDVRLCLAVARSGTASGAGLALDLSHTTVLRRIAGLEQRLGAVLFHKRSRGYELTEAGSEFVARAERAEVQIGEALAFASGRDESMGGTIRIAVPDITGAGIIHILKAFCDEHPDVSIAMDSTQRPQPLTSGEAHIAVVLTDSPPPGQMGTPIGPCAFAAYAARALLAEASPEELSWVGLDRSLYHIPVGRFERRIAPSRPKAHTVGTLNLHYAAIRGGLGVGLLPCATGDSNPDLQRCGPLFMDISLQSWVLHRRDLRSATRVTALAQRLRQALAKQVRLLAGQKPAYGPRAFKSLEQHARDM